MVEQPQRYCWRLTTKKTRIIKRTKCALTCICIFIYSTHRKSDFVRGQYEIKHLLGICVHLLVGCLGVSVCVALLDARLVCRLLVFAFALWWTFSYTYLRAYSNAINRTTYLELYTVCRTADVWFVAVFIRLCEFLICAWVCSLFKVSNSTEM